MTGNRVVGGRPAGREWSWWGCGSVKLTVPLAGHKLPDVKCQVSRTGSYTRKSSCYLVHCYLSDMQLQLLDIWTGAKLVTSCLCMLPPHCACCHPTPTTVAHTTPINTTPACTQVLESVDPPYSSFFARSMLKMMHPSLILRVKSNHAAMLRRFAAGCSAVVFLPPLSKKDQELLEDLS